MGVDGAEWCGIQVSRDGSKDTLKSPSPTEDGAEYSVACPSLCPSVHFGAVLLVSKHDGDELSLGQEGRIGVGNDMLLEVREDQG